MNKAVRVTMPEPYCEVCEYEPRAGDNINEIVAAEYHSEATWEWIERATYRVSLRRGKARGVLLVEMPTDWQDYGAEMAKDCWWHLAEWRFGKPPQDTPSEEITVTSFIPEPHAKPVCSVGTPDGL